MTRTFSWAGLVGAGLLVAAATGPVQAAPVNVQVTVENLAPASSITFAPLHFGFNQGSFDGFNAGSTASAAIVSIAEGGSGSAWLPAFAAADPAAVISTIGGALGPGMAGTSSVLMVDPSINRYFTFASMVVPSNDLFIGNDGPTKHQIFDMSGNLLVSDILLTVADIWDANSEVADPANAAFIVGGNNDLRTPENGTVAFDASELGVFNGLMTAGGYSFSNASLGNDTPVYRISFSASAVPEPASWAMLIGGLFVVGGLLRRARVAPAFA